MAVDVGFARSMTASSPSANDHGQRYGPVGARNVKPGTRPATSRCRSYVTRPPRLFVDQRQSQRQRGPLPLRICHGPSLGRQAMSHSVSLLCISLFSLARDGFPLESEPRASGACLVISAPKLSSLPDRRSLLGPSLR